MSPGRTENRRSGPLRLPAALALGLALALPAAAPAAAEPRVAKADNAEATDALADSGGKKTSSPHAREKAHGKRLDKAIAPLLDYDISETDAKNIRAAIKALAAGKTDEAAQIADRVKDPLGRKLILWYRLRRGEGEAVEFARFLKQNPDWPSRSVLRQRMEQVLFAEGGSSDEILSYLGDGAPESAAGMAVLASVHLAHDETEKARALASKIWREEDLPEDLERGFLARFKSLLTQEDHKWRLDRLLVEDVRWRRGRKQQADLARRVIPLLSESEQRKANDRLKVFLHKKGKKSTLKSAGKGKTEDWGLVFHKVQQLRRSRKLTEAANLMLKAPTDPDEVVNLDDWWSERQKLAYFALKENKPKLAYSLVRDAGPLSVNPLNEQRFMAGWLALRYLKDPAAAERYFAAYTKSADGPLSRAKSNYWLGRAHEAQGEHADAKAAYREAARQSDTFHGLLAMQKLEPGRRHIVIEPPAVPTPDQIERFTTLDAVQAVALMHEADVSRSIERIFLRHLDELDDSEGWAVMVAHLAKSVGDTQSSVRIAKAAVARGHNLLYYSYPTHALPKYKPLRSPPESAMILGLARQETEFNTGIVSGAGARGILQVMKGTARHVCRQYRIKCHYGKLQSDPAYNTMIGSAYIADRLAEFSGSYVLGLSSYNAGPGRTRQWIREFGDPRTNEIDPIDWIERIPFEETRRYVAKVLSNIQVYRARLGEEDTALRLEQDLARAREASISPPHRKSGTDTARTGK
jgi:soluble lytic murein transglycosylase